jgi:hypothetical protein
MDEESILVNLAFVLCSIACVLCFVRNGHELKITRKVKKSAATHHEGRRGPRGKGPNARPAG